MNTFGLVGSVKARAVKASILPHRLPMTTKAVRGLKECIVFKAISKNCKFYVGIAEPNITDPKAADDENADGIKYLIRSLPAADVPVLERGPGGPDGGLYYVCD